MKRFAIVSALVLLPPNVKVSEDSTTLVNITDWTAV